MQTMYERGRRAFERGAPRDEAESDHWLCGYAAGYPDDLNIVR